MKSEKIFRNSVLLLAACLSLAIFAGCAQTVTKPVVRPTVTNYSGTNQNSGFIGFLEDGRGVIDGRKRDEYNILISLYGGVTNFIPPLTFDFGISPYTNNTFIISQEALSDFQQMKIMYRNR